MSTTTVNIDAKLVKELRDKTGAPFGDCKNALVEANGDIEQAVIVLRKKGVATAGKKASRTTNEGSVASYIHAGGKIGVLLELNCESDFVARTDDFRALAKDLCLHIASARPMAVSKEQVPADVVEREKRIFEAQAVEEKKPEAMREKIIQGRLKKFFEETVLLEQKFIKDDKVTVGDLVKALAGKTGENVQVRRFARFELGAD